MNINICKLCKRYKEDTEGRSDVWMCAKLAFSFPSRVVPKHNRFVFDDYQYITKDSEIP